ncbi:hypothetical protein SAMN05192574_11562 [Mucilaginibacter gossypiicola]|uniref:Uncharacterized protein n=1 Tax=Mucilaginibacter gossypiicola TaxID=551995 RepID=A0A1H8TE95_9SPHI|nr:hypothetical protein [Mucilaginibacter gossypiicola]SEO88818.1 hypothetical protein SAMN05192574_11562 [Mucilaginibacter gossypiicola]
MIRNSLIIVSIAICLLACGNNSKKETTLADTNKVPKDTTGQHISDKNDTTTHHTMASDTGTANTSQSDWLITPGKSIGYIVLNDDVKNAIKRLGKPDSSDAAMGSSLMAWFANHNPAGNRTSVFAHHNMGGKDEQVSYVQKILVTSPQFKTGDGIGVGSSKQEIQKNYTLKPMSTYSSKSGKVQVYTDLAKGISFEIDGSGKCVGVVVHKANDTAVAYLNMH